MKPLLLLHPRWGTWIRYLCMNMADNFYQFSANTPHGQPISMSEFKGKLVLVVNTATQCGLAPQFEGLEK